MSKVFLGGTCAESTWRDDLIPLLKIDYFNPVVKDWTPAHQKEEIRQREFCDYVLYTITHEMTGVYSIAEAVDDSNKNPGKTLFCVLEKGFTKSQLKSLQAVSDMIKKNGGSVFTNLKDVAKYLNRPYNMNTFHRIEI
jgi:hypothetical protein